MKVKIGNNSEYVVFKDFKSESEDFGYKNSDSDLQFLRMTISININGFSSEIRASVRKEELIYFKENLNKLYDTLVFQFSFSNFEDNINIKFVPSNTGQININGYLRNQQYSADLNFTIVTDQTYIPGVIKELNQIL